MSTATDEQLYPRVLRRVQAGMIDGFVIPVSTVATIFLMATAGVDSGTIKSIAAVFMILALEPLAVAWTGGSIGHHVVGMRVRRVDADHDIGVAAALVRFVVKTLLGLFSFFMV